MASENPRYGSLWTPEEREIRKAPVRMAQKILAKIQEQVRRTGIHAPQFKEQAEAAFRRLYEGLGVVVKMNLNNNGPKYQALSPEETDHILAALPELLKSWHELVTSPEFAAAVRQKNREIRAVNAGIREHNRAVQAQNDVLWAQMDAALRKMDEGDLEGSLDIASKAGIL